MIPWRSFESTVDTLWWSKKNSESKNAPLKLPKVVKLETILGWLEVSFSKKEEFLIFLEYKRIGKSRDVHLLRIKSPDHIQPITYPQLCHTMLRSLYIWIWSCLVALQKKLFWRPQRFPFQKKVLQSDFKPRNRTMYESCCGWSRFLIRSKWTSLGLSIPFYCRKLKNSYFFQNDTLSHPKIVSNFTTFESFSGAIFDSENFLDHHSVSMMPSKLLHGTIALQQSDLECLKRL